MIAGASLGTADPAASNTTALQVTAVGAPQRVHGSDGREHIDYDLVVTNSFTAEVTLTSLVVRGGGNELLALSGDALAAATRSVRRRRADDSIPASSTVAMYVDVVLPRSAGRTVPKRLSNRIAYTFAARSTVRGDHRQHDRPRARPARRSADADRDRSAASRRGLGLAQRVLRTPRSTTARRSFPSNGTYVAPETFAVDYIRLVDGRFYEGDGTQNTDWFGYGAPSARSRAERWSSAVDDRPEVPPFIAADNPTVTQPSQFGGNGVVVKIRPGVFAHYCHLQPGSVRVEVGERVRTGQKLGLLGNSGNTPGRICISGSPTDRNPLTSNSLPFEIDRFRLEGTAAAGPLPRARAVGQAARERRRTRSSRR